VLSDSIPQPVLRLGPVLLAAIRAAAADVVPVDGVPGCCRGSVLWLSNSPSGLGLHTPTCAQAGSGAVGGDGRLVGVLSVRLVGVCSP